MTNNVTSEGKCLSLINNSIQHTTAQEQVHILFFSRTCFSQDFILKKRQLNFTFYTKQSRGILCITKSKTLMTNYLVYKMPEKRSDDTFKMLVLSDPRYKTQRSRIFTYNGEEQHIFTLEKLKLANVLHFCLRNYLKRLIIYQSCCSFSVHWLTDSLTNLFSTTQFIKQFSAVVQHHIQCLCG